MTIRQTALPRDRSDGGHAVPGAEQSGPRPAPHASTQTRRLDLAARVAGAVAAVLIGWIHVVDQGGLTSLKDPAYVGVGYWLLELTAVAVAVTLLTGGVRQRLAAWWVAAGAAVGPIVGYALSRGPGLPGYVDDRGNWTELLGVQALVTEAALLALSGWVLWRCALSADPGAGGQPEA